MYFFIVYNPVNLRLLDPNMKFEKPDPVKKNNRIHNTVQNKASL